MKKISILSLTLIGALYISNANALKVQGKDGYCITTQSFCVDKLIRTCETLYNRDRNGLIVGAHLEGDVTYTTYLSSDYRTKCYTCSAKCVAGGVSFIIDSTTSDETPTVSVDPNTSSTTSTTAPKSKNLKK